MTSILLIILIINEQMKGIFIFIFLDFLVKGSGLETFLFFLFKIGS